MSYDPYEPMFGEPVSNWYRWFAWRPVETVDRGKQWHQYLHGGSDWWFQHVVEGPKV